MPVSAVICLLVSSRSKRSMVTQHLRNCSGYRGQPGHMSMKLVRVSGRSALCRGIRPQGCRLSWGADCRGPRASASSGWSSLRLPVSEGFSLKVNSRDRTGEVALFSISGGAHLIFSSRQKLNRCLPNHRDEVDVYMFLITDAEPTMDVWS